VNLRKGKIVRQHIRIVCNLMGDIRKKVDLSIKYGDFFNSLRNCFNVVDIYADSLRGPAKYWNAAQVFSILIHQWKKHFFKNVSAFSKRSRETNVYYQTFQGPKDVVLQLGAMYDSTSEDGIWSVGLYTDNTLYITSHNLKSGRNPFKSTELHEWTGREEKFYQHTFHICTRSRIMKCSLIEDYGISGGKISVIGGGVNFSKLPEFVKREARSNQTLLFVGMDFCRNGGDLALLAFNRVRKSFSSAQLIIFTKNQIPKGLSLSGVRVLEPVWNRSEKKLFQGGCIYNASSL